jgi:uroporphyrinogen III methyltransferase/synthase
MDKAVLVGKKILLTRPREQSEDWAARLRQLGAQPIIFPLIEISPTEDSSPINEAVGNLNQVDILVFTSVNGVKYFQEALKKHKGSTQLPTTILIAAIGKKTAESINNIGWAVSYMPEEYTATALGASIENVRDKNILIPTTPAASDELVSILRDRGATVEEVFVYQTRKLQQGRNELLKLINEGLNVITFASPSAVEGFVEMAGQHTGNALIACIGPVTAARAEEEGLSIDIIPEKYTAEGLTEALIKYYENERSSTQAAR